MASKNYIVRDGFVLVRTMPKADGKGTYEKITDAGEVVELDDADYAAHAHKLELADPKERVKAAAAEKAAAVAASAALDPAELVKQLVAALSQATAAAQQPAA